MLGLFILSTLVDSLPTTKKPEPSFPNAIQATKSEPETLFPPDYTHGPSFRRKYSWESNNSNCCVEDGVQCVLGWQVELFTQRITFTSLKYIFFYE